MKKIILTEKAPAPIGPYSQAVFINNILFASGQIALDPVTGNIAGDDVRSQAIQVMKNVGALLSEAGLTYGDIVKTSIFLADMNDFAVVNEVYASYFTADFPARETVQVSRLPKDAKVEISVVAVKA